MPYIQSNNNKIINPLPKGIRITNIKGRRIKSRTFKLGLFWKEMFNLHLQAFTSKVNRHNEKHNEFFKSYGETK